MTVPAEERDPAPPVDVEPLDIDEVGWRMSNEPEPWYLRLAMRLLVGKEPT
jgi:hypothetical protein